MTIPFTQLDQLYINGAWVNVDGPREEVLNPASEAVIGLAPTGDLHSADAALAAAREAFDNGPWPWLSMAERAGYLRRMHAALVSKREQIAALIIAEVGCSQGVTYAMQVDMPLAHVLTAIEQSLHSDSQQIPVHANPTPSTRVAR